MPRISVRKKVMNDIAKKILTSKRDPFAILLELDDDKLKNLTSSDVRTLMDVRVDK